MLVSKIQEVAENYDDKIMVYLLFNYQLAPPLYIPHKEDLATLMSSFINDKRHLFSEKGINEKDALLKVYLECIFVFTFSPYYHFFHGC